MGKLKTAVAFCVHDDHWFLSAALDSFRPAGDLYVFVSRLPWNGEPGNWKRAASVAAASGAKVIEGEWPVEVLHRQGAVQTLLDLGYTHALMPDTDEIAEPRLLDSLVKIADVRLAQRVYVHMDTYWSRPDCIIRPRERLTPLLMMELSAVYPEDLHMFNGRLYGGGDALVLPPELGVLHHLSYVGPDERIQRKITTWSHSHEVQNRWWNDKWLAWEDDRLLRDLHPTHPPVYSYVERINRPEPLAEVCDYRAVEDDPEAYLVQGVPPAWSKVSIVIPLHGGPTEIRQCLESLAKLQDIFHEVIVVDDASPDSAASVASSFEFVNLIINEKNLGFAATCNTGARASSGEVILFLNSDTIVPRSGLIRLVQTLMSSGAVGAAGPMSNNVGYHQLLPPTYSSPETMGFFAEDLARSDRPDREVEMLVGFCFAVRRSIWNEIGEFDERFVRGMFEDTDYCYRLARAGYKLKIAGRAFVHHWGSRTINRVLESPNDLLQENGERFRAKWAVDLESGYASHLPGFGMDRGLVKFNESVNPDKRIEALRKKAKKARISLCIIAKNEERCIEACLKTASLVAFETIVVDTGSTDRTKEIAKACGAKVFDFPWTDSFADARNESMRHATGDWIFWVDCDDTLTLAAAEAIVEAALRRQAEAFIIPVQFVTASMAKGTSVDHVKLFRNFKGMKWQRRIHEQILHEFSARGIVPFRLDVQVLHTHYDNSPEGQARKYERDMPLLLLELKDDPNDPFTLFNLGMTEHHVGKYAEAIDWLTQALCNASPQNTHTRKIYAILAYALRDDGKEDAALEMLAGGLGHFPEDPELHYQTAVIFQRQGRAEEAITHLRSYGEDTSDHFSSLDIGVLTYLRWTRLGELYAQLGNYPEAKKWFGVCVEREPWYEPAASGLFEAAFQNGDVRTVSFALEAILAATGPTSEWAARVCRYADLFGGPDAVLQRLGSLIERFPNTAEPRLTYARVLTDLGRLDLAFPHLNRLASGGCAAAQQVLTGLNLNTLNLM